MKFIFFIFLLTSCLMKQDQLKNQKNKGHEELYSMVSDRLIEEESPEYVTVTVGVLQNAVDGIHPELKTFKDHFSPTQQTQLIGGVQTQKAYLDILRKKVKNLFLVNVGHSFTQDYKIQDISLFYKTLNVDALTLDEEDFNMVLEPGQSSSLEQLKQKVGSLDSSVVNSQLYELKTLKNLDWPNLKQEMVKDYEGIKVGFLSFMTDDIIQKIPPQNRLGLYYDQALTSLLLKARNLRSKGLDVIIVHLTQGLDCHSLLMETTKLPSSRVNFDPYREGVCDLEFRLGSILRRLPPGLVDIVISSHQDEKINNEVNGMIVLNAPAKGSGLGLTQMTFRKSTKEIVPELTKIYQPTTFCHDFFKETDDCYADDESVSHAKRVKAKFLDEEVNPDFNLNFQKSQLTSSASLSEVLDYFSANFVFKSSSKDSSQLSVIKVTGRELREILIADFSREKKKFWYPTLSLKMMSDIQLEKNYRLLISLKDLNDHPFLKKKLKFSELLSHFSWEKDLNLDQLKLKMAAPSR